MVKQKVNFSVKRKAVEQLSERPSKIFHSEMSSTVLSILGVKWRYIDQKKYKYCKNECSTEVAA
jgi:hypothetical protein